MTGKRRPICVYDFSQLVTQFTAFAGRKNIRALFATLIVQNSNVTSP